MPPRNNRQYSSVSPSTSMSYSESPSVSYSASPSFSPSPSEADNIQLHYQDGEYFCTETGSSHLIEEVNTSKISMYIKGINGHIYKYWKDNSPTATYRSVFKVDNKPVQKTIVLTPIIKSEFKEASEPEPLWYEEDLVPCITGYNYKLPK